jgi:hypothetical protein
MPVQLVAQAGRFIVACSCTPTSMEPHHERRASSSEYLVTSRGPYRFILASSLEEAAKIAGTIRMPYVSRCTLSSSASTYGIEVQATPRDVGFCAHAMLEPRTMAGAPTAGLAPIAAR